MVFMPHSNKASKTSEIILGVTLARGGSKGLPRKNVKILCGKPLIAWTIDAAKKSKMLDRYIVSTEDPEIKKVAESYGAEVLDRPVELATDEASVLSVLQDMLKKVPADIVVILQCTSPVRDDGLIDSCIQQFIENCVDSLATGFMCDLFEWGTYSGRRQDLQEFFYDDGNVYVVKADSIREGNLWGKLRERVIISREQNIDIDDIFDFWINEKILEKRISESDI